MLAKPYRDEAPQDLAAQLQLGALEMRVWQVSARQRCACRPSRPSRPWSAAQRRVCSGCARRALAGCLHAVSCGRQPSKGLACAREQLPTSPLPLTGSNRCACSAPAAQTMQEVRQLASKLFANSNKLGEALMIVVVVVCMCV